MTGQSWTLRVFQLNDLELTPILAVALAKARLNVHGFVIADRGFVAVDTSSVFEERALHSAIAQWAPTADLRHVTTHDGPREAPSAGLFPVAG